jgi:hypothetical protein
MYCEINADVTSNYTYNGGGVSPAATYTPVGLYTNNYDTTTSIRITNGNAMIANDTNNSFFLTFENCKAAGFTNFSSLGTYTFSNGTNTPVVSSEVEGIFTVAAAVSSITVRTFANNYSAGTYTLWGA